jgi:nitroimidazol reductase NimA-like FMN-containing flavoprotein (pyridoxamine 5'-phosphate oxidase superfamily)
VDPQEITEELEHPGARNLLDSATLLRLAYNESDGFPRVIPIGFYWNGNQIVVCTAATAPVEPAWARFFDFGAGRMPSFLTKLAGDP